MTLEEKTKSEENLKDIPLDQKLYFLKDESKRSYIEKAAYLSVKLAKFYESSGELKKAKDMWKQAAILTGAPTYYIMAGFPEKAEEMWNEIGNMKSKEGDFSSAAEAYRRAGFPEKAEEMLKKKNKHGRDKE